MLDVPPPRVYVCTKRKEEHMALMYITEEAYNRLSDLDTKVCVYCDTSTVRMACPSCGEYKGLMSIEDWESYTGEVWE
jgi:hypothetical protein